MMETIIHQTFKDNRGSYTPVPLDILDTNWTQCSISVNEHNFTFRGLHYQTNPPQTKYVKVVKGLIVDVIVDLETNEVEYAMVGENEAVFIPKTKAHGFLTLSPDTVVVYLVKGEYNPSSEHSLVWSDNERVKEIIKLNKEGVSPKDLLEFVKIEKIVELGYSNVVGQDSLTRFEKNFKKKPNSNQNRNQKFPRNPANNKPNNSSKENNA